MADKLDSTYDPSGSNIYKYKASMKFVVNNEVTDVNSFSIKSIAIDYNYNDMNMPMMFVTAALDRNLIDKMVQNQDSGIIIFNIQRCITNSDMPELYTDYVNDKFVYFISDDINKNEKIDYMEEDREDIFKITTIGLLSLDNINNNKKVMTGVLNGKLSAIMYYVTSHLPILIEPPDTNTSMNIMLPAMNSVGKALEYINSIHVLYNVPYRFFIDYDCAYLISSRGKPIKKKNESISTVFIEVRNNYDPASKLQGMIEDKDRSMYMLYIDGPDCEVSDTNVSAKTYTNIVSTNTSGSVDKTALSNRSSDTVVKEKTRYVRTPNGNSGLLNNMVTSIDNSAIQLLVQKVDIDSSKFTINKEYIIKADEVYHTEKFNGRYLLTRKRELYVREDETFSMNTMLLLEKISSDDTRTAKSTRIK